MRILFIAPALQSAKVDTHGYTEFVDVHICVNEELSAIKLFVDSHYDVRTQVTVESKPKEDEPVFTELAGLNIPVPKKAEFLDHIIVPTQDFGGYNLTHLFITDKLRRRDYILEGEKKGKKITTASPLGFIDIEGYIGEDIETEFAEDWLLNLANSMETLVYLDENLLCYIGVYLDYMIVSKPLAKELVELNLLLHATMAIPHSTEEHISIFEGHVEELFPGLNIVNYRIFKAIMQNCLKNEQKTLMNVYEEMKIKITQLHSFPYFLSVVSQLVSFGFVNIEKLEFYTLN
ncbi:MAG: hypothetical protein GOP50_02055 [Candidatus Heimdallarchaeota archaeon]|nr:hypothetical protein [Candidatus Heimdallarchaeota archaeon]